MVNRKRCPNNPKHRVQRVGFSRTGKQRYRCPTCNIRFTWANVPNAPSLRFRS